MDAADPAHRRRKPRPEWIPLFLAALLATAAFAKARSPAEFEATLTGSRLISVAFAPFVARSLVSLEFLLAAALCLPALRKTALQTACVLFCTFISFSAWRWIQGIGVPCHCFGILLRMDPYQAILLNVVLLSLVLRMLIRLEKPASDLCAG